MYISTLELQRTSSDMCLNSVIPAQARLLPFIHFPPRYNSISTL